MLVITLIFIEYILHLIFVIPAKHCLVGKVNTVYNNTTALRDYYSVLLHLIGLLIKYRHSEPKQIEKYCKNYYDILQHPKYYKR